MSDEHKTKFIQAPIEPDTIKKRVNKRYEIYGDKYISNDAYNKLKKMPINTYSYANILDIDDNLMCLCYCNKCEQNYKIHKMTLRTRNYTGQEYCTICNPLEKQYSFGEKEVVKYIKSIYNGQIIENDRTTLNGKEIDIYLPDLALGFEFDGTYWHADPRFYKSDTIIESNGKTAEEIWKKDKDKELFAESLGIFIARIPEYDWIYNNEKMKILIKDLIYY